MINRVPPLEGAEIHYVKEGEILSKASKSSQRFVNKIKLAVAENYIENLGEEASKGMLEKARQGMWPSYAPYGYLNDRNKRIIIPDPIRAPFIKRAYELASTGMFSYSLLSRQLFKEGMTTTKGTPVPPSNLQNYLTKLMYTGDFIWNGVYCKGTYESIISHELFEKTQFALGIKQKPKATKHSSLFSGLLTCGKCGCSITYEIKTKPSGRTYFYYHCTNGKRNCAVKPSVSESYLDEMFQTVIQQIKVSHEIVEWTHREFLKSFEHDRSASKKVAAELESQRAHLQKLIDASYEDKVAGLLDTDEWLEKNNGWKIKLRNVMEAINNHARQNEDFISNVLSTLEPR